MAGEAYCLLLRFWGLGSSCRNQSWGGPDRGLLHSVLVVELDPAAKGGGSESRRTLAIAACPGSGPSPSRHLSLVAYRARYQSHLGGSARYGKTWHVEYARQKTRIRQFRALTVLSLRVAALSPHPIALGQLGPHLYSNADRNAAGSAIARTLVLLSPGHLQPTSDIVSEDSQPARGVIETGVVPVVTVLLITACAVAAAYLGATIAKEIKAVNFDDELTKRLLATQARAIEIVSMHVERERIAGHELPFDEHEHSLLLGLEDLQRQLATLMQRPMPAPFQGATEFVRAATSFIPMALLGVAAIWLLQKHGRRE